MKVEYVFVFLFGFLSCAFLFFVFSFSGFGISGFGILDLGSLSSPSDWVSEDDIIVLDDRIILMIENATLSNYVATGSMKPLFDAGANGIRVVPKSEDEISVGDIVSFGLGEKLVVHRVVEKGVDGEGVYFVTRGDNNLISDGKVRFWDIEYVTIGIIF